MRLNLCRQPQALALALLMLLVAGPAVQDRLAAQSSSDDPAGLQNVLQVSPRIYSGSEPHGDAGFGTLRELGIRTVVSVDGARPDLDQAHAHNLRYVHIPLGYDGIDRRSGEMLAKLVREAKGPIYIHCHHGKHRGPAAAAVACIAAGEADAARAIEILEQAGTSRDYGGLWRDVEHYTAPPADAVLPELQEVADVGSLAAAMASIDRAYDNLAAARDSEWVAPQAHPDLVPVQEAVLLRERLHEAGRGLDETAGPGLRQWLAESEAAARKLTLALKRQDTAASDRHFAAVARSCTRCHRQFRDR